jgi:undecaprenyl-diphosphatase
MSSAFILAFLQGATEFLPISSSAHLILLPQLMDWRDQGLGFDIAVHMGTLAAVLVYFRDDIGRLWRAWRRSVTGPHHSDDSRLAWIIIASVIPIGVVGLLAHDIIATMLRAPLVIAMATIVFALVMGWANQKGRRERGLDQVGWRDGIVVGLAQILALIPGTSRSGITMTAGLMLGLRPEAAARLSFLMAIPTIAAAGVWQMWSWGTADRIVDWPTVILAALASGLVAYMCVHWFLQFVERVGLLPFVAYRLLLGAWLLYIYV